MGLQIKTRSIIDSAVTTCEPFNRGNIIGVRGNAGASGSGRLPEPFGELFMRHMNADLIKFVIYSYATPIAWRLADGDWIIPPVHYSQSTTIHQSAVRSAIH